MKGCCLGLVASALLLVGGATIVTRDPQLPGQAAGTVREGAAWLGAVLSKVGAAPAPSPTGVGAAPAPANTARVVLITPHPSPTAAAHPTPLPTPLFTPPPTAVLTWSSADCAWVASTLAHDAQLDTAAEQTVPSAAAYYAQWAARWLEAARIGALACAGDSLSAAQRADPAQWFASAILTHQADTVARPGDKGWNDQWIAIYQRLETLWAELG
jgi:hypothetical protein